MIPEQKSEPIEYVVEFLDKLNEDDMAEKLIDTFAKYSTNIEQFNLLGKLYHDIRASDKAIAMVHKTLEMCTHQNQQDSIKANLIKVYNNTNYPEKALPYIEELLSRNPNNTDILLEKVFSLYLMNRKEESEKILRSLKLQEAFLSDRHKVIVNFNLGTYDMEAGNFIQGLGEFLINVKKLGIWFSPRELPFKQWFGGPAEFPGQPFVMFMEGGGIGDDFITIRFADDLRQLGFDPIFLTQKKDVCNIFNQNGYKSTLDEKSLPYHNAVWQYALHVPLYLPSTEESVRREKYLQPSEEARKKWAWMQSEELQIGIRWQGNSKNERDLHRKIPFADMYKMISNALNGKPFKLYSLQVGEVDIDAPEYDGHGLIDITSDIKSFDDTFAICENLDFVVSSCTSVLHASAIMGTPTIGLVPISAYFPWLSPCERPNCSIWYGDNLRIFRQTTPRQWDEPLAQAEQYIKDNLI